MDLAWLAAFTKPLPALLLGMLAWRSGGRAARLLSVGLLFAAIGDELLLGEADWRFLLGMLCFAAMQVLYVTSFHRLARGRIKPRAIVIVPIIAFAAAVVLAIAPHAGWFALPVTAYSVLLAAMVWLAFAAAERIDRYAGALVAAGAVGFMISDTLFGFVKFYPGFPLSGANAEMWIDGTYFAAQFAIANGVVFATRDVTA